MADEFKPSKCCLCGEDIGPGQLAPDPYGPMGYGDYDWWDDEEHLAHVVCAVALERRIAAEKARRRLYSRSEEKAYGITPEQLCSLRTARQHVQVFPTDQTEHEAFGALMKKGFLRKSEGGVYAVTAKGRAALGA